MNNLIAVTIGDINGIGLELLLKLFKNKKIKNFVLFSNIYLFKQYLKKNNIKIKLNIINTTAKNFEFKKNFLNIYNFKSSSFEDNTLKSIKISHKHCINNNFIGMVTLPIRKDLIINSVMKSFIGHTEYLQKLEKKKYSNMILYHKKIIISPLTTHIKLKSVSKKLTNKYLINQVSNLDKTLKKDLNIKNPKIIISGINPHAGENGKIGNEEEKIIKPIIKKLKSKNIIIEGPYSADSVLINANIKKYDCFLFIYHDQALIPFKFISKFSGVNFTGNLNVIRTSPDHGTAYNLKGSNNVSDISLKNCFYLINKIYKNRITYDKSKKITKSKLFNR